MLAHRGLEDGTRERGAGGACADTLHGIAVPVQPKFDPVRKFLDWA